MFGKHVRGFQEACSTGHYVRQDVRMFEIVRRLNSFVLNPMFECSLNICSDPIFVVNLRNPTKVRRIFPINPDLTNILRATDLDFANF